MIFNSIILSWNDCIYILYVTFIIICFSFL